MKQLSMPTRSKAGSTESVRFNDGMLVTAEDLNAATRYPLDLLQVLVRSYFGCGVVCGLGLGRDPDAGEPGKRPADCPPEAGSFIVQVERGVALDCHGFPLELCGPLKLDLSPDPCSCDEPPTELCLAIRHVASSTAPKRGCGCCGDASDDNSQVQCSRERDHVEIRAFSPDALPDNLCRREDTQGDAPKECSDAAQPAAAATAAPVAGTPERGARDYLAPRPEVQDRCDCLTSCPDCGCCGEAWVLLGCVTLDKSGVRSFDLSGRRYVKPIECFCAGRKSPAKELEEPAVAVEVKEMRAQMEQFKALADKHAEMLTVLQTDQQVLQKAIVLVDKTDAVIGHAKTPKKPG